MLSDKRILLGNKQNRERDDSVNLEKFVKSFVEDYEYMRMRAIFRIKENSADPYGVALMCNDYSLGDFVLDSECSCEDVFKKNGKVNDFDDVTYICRLPFRELLLFLHMGYDFDFSRALALYENQGDALDVFKQVMTPFTYLKNREGNIVNRRVAPAHLKFNEAKPIGVPHIWKLCDGMAGPFIVQKFHDDLHWEVCECHGFGDGMFLISNNKIIDVVRINDTSMIDLPLEKRLKFAYKCTDYDVEDFGKARSLRSILEVGKLLGANRDDGLLVRNAADEFLGSRWFNWSKDSVVFFMKTKNGIFVDRGTGGGAQPDFHTLEGKAAEICQEEAFHVRGVYLDKWDVDEFRKILDLKPKA